MTPTAQPVAGPVRGGRGGRVRRRRGARVQRAGGHVPGRLPLQRARGGAVAGGVALAGRGRVAGPGGSLRAVRRCLPLAAAWAGGPGLGFRCGRAGSALRRPLCASLWPSVGGGWLVAVGSRVSGVDLRAPPRTPAIAAEISLALVALGAVGDLLATTTVGNLMQGGEVNHTPVDLPALHQMAFGCRRKEITHLWVTRGVRRLRRLVPAVCRHRHGRSRRHRQRHRRAPSPPWVAPSAWRRGGVAAWFVVSFESGAVGRVSPVRWPSWMMPPEDRSHRALASTARRNTHFPRPSPEPRPWMLGVRC